MTDEELREMQERVTQIRELKQHQSWTIFEDWLRYRLSHHQRRVLGGRIGEMLDYREEVGTIKGLTTAIMAADEIEEIVNRELEARREAAIA